MPSGCVVLGGRLHPHWTRRQSVVKTGGWDGRPDFNIACGAPHFLGPAGTLMLHDPWHKNATAKPDPVVIPRSKTSLDHMSPHKRKLEEKAKKANYYEFSRTSHRTPAPWPPHKDWYRNNGAASPSSDEGEAPREEIRPLAPLPGSTVPLSPAFSRTRTGMRMSNQCIVSTDGQPNDGSETPSGILWPSTRNSVQIMGSHALLGSPHNSHISSPHIFNDHREPVALLKPRCLPDLGSKRVYVYNCNTDSGSPSMNSLI